MIWVYMGPRELMPELPQLEMALVPASLRYVTKKWQDCNWVQSVEGAIDTSHFSFLHKVLATDEATARAAMAKAAIGDQAKPDDRIRWVQNDPRPSFQVHGPRYRPGDRRRRARPTAPISTGASRSS